LLLLLLLLLTATAMVCLMRVCMMLNTTAYHPFGTACHLRSCRQEMGYNYYIPGRNDPFMKGGPCDLYHIM
jgi:hypothetical protein